MNRLFNEVLRVADRLTSPNKASAQLLHCLREMAALGRESESTVNEIKHLLDIGADPNAKGVFAGKRNATDLAIFAGPKTAQCLLEAGGLVGPFGIERLAELSVYHQEDYDEEEYPSSFSYGEVARLCVKRCPAQPAWRALPRVQNYWKHTTIGQLEYSCPGISKLLEDTRASLGLEPWPALGKICGQENLDIALVKSLCGLEIDCYDPINNQQRKERVKSLLTLGANPNAATKFGRAMGAAINTTNKELVHTLVARGGRATREDMVWLVERRLSQENIDHPSDVTLVLEDQAEGAAFSEVVAHCYPLEFSWDYNFKTEDWEGDEIEVNMAAALASCLDLIHALQEGMALNNASATTAPPTSRRL